VAAHDCHYLMNAVAKYPFLLQLIGDYRRKVPFDELSAISMKIPSSSMSRRQHTDSQGAFAMLCILFLSCSVTFMGT
jgi:hypothetical protein